MVVNMEADCVIQVDIDMDFDLQFHQLQAGVAVLGWRPDYEVQHHKSLHVTQPYPEND